MNDAVKELINFDRLRPGLPCDHPGCSSHLSHSCEGCGRYAAGTQTGPDVEMGRSYIENLGGYNPVMRQVLMAGQQNEWTWDQTLTALVIISSKRS